MKTMCVKIGSVILAIAIPALFVFVVRLDLVNRFEDRVSRQDVIDIVAKAISRITQNDNIIYAKEPGVSSQPLQHRETESTKSCTSCKSVAPVDINEMEPQRPHVKLNVAIPIKLPFISSLIFL